MVSVVSAFLPGGKGKTIADSLSTIDTYNKALYDIGEDEFKLAKIEVTLTQIWTNLLNEDSYHSFYKPEVQDNNILVLAQKFNFYHRISKPNNLSATAKDGGIELTWDDVPNAQSYNLYYSTDKNDLSGHEFSVTSPYLLKNLTNDIPYYFALTAKDVGGGESDFSNEVSAIPQSKSVSIDSVSISVGGLTSFLIKDDGSLFSWGYGDGFGPVYGTSGDVWDEPAPIVYESGKPFLNVDSVRTSGPYSVAVKTDGTLFHWGWFNDVKHYFPVPITDISGQSIGNIKSIKVNYFNSFAITQDSTLLMWGCANIWSPMWSECPDFIETPRVVTDFQGHALSGIENIYTISHSNGFSHFAIKGGRLYKLEPDMDGNIIAVPVIDYDSNPIVNIKAITSALSKGYGIDGGDMDIVILKADGKVEVLTEVNYIDYEYDMTNVKMQVKPVLVVDKNEVSLENIIMMVGDGGITLALRSDGKILSWGRNNGGVLGNGTTIDQYKPGFVVDSSGQPITGVEKIAATYGYAVALKSDGTLLTWGNNYDSGFFGLYSAFEKDVTYPFLITDINNLPYYVNP